MAGTNYRPSTCPWQTKTKEVTWPLIHLFSHTRFKRWATPTTYISCTLLRFEEMFRSARIHINMHSNKTFFIEHHKFVDWLWLVNNWQSLALKHEDNVKQPLKLHKILYPLLGKLDSVNKTTFENPRCQITKSWVLPGREFSTKKKFQYAKARYMCLSILQFTSLLHVTSNQSLTLTPSSPFFPESPAPSTTSTAWAMYWTKKCHRYC